MKRLNIIGLMGNAKAGKSTSAEFMVADGCGKALAFADKLKAIVTEMFALPPEACYDDRAKESPTEFPCHICPHCHGINIEKVQQGPVTLGSCRQCSTIGELSVFHGFWTTRMIMQHVGTEGFRAVNAKVWSSFAIRTGCRALENGAQFVVYSDTRFQTECDAIWEVGGEVWRIKRPSAEGKVGLARHASEIEQTTISDDKLQAIIDNNGSLEDLRVKVTAQLQRFIATRRLAA
jgi:hypothetical protein